MSIIRKCKLDVMRIERCLICPVKCNEFMLWYKDNKKWYEDKVDYFVSKYPNKYEKEYVIMDTTKKQTQPKMVAIVNNNQIEEIIPKNNLTKSTEAEKYANKRIIELTGKEYDIIVSISLKQKKLTEISGNTASKRGGKK